MKRFKMPSQRELRAMYPPQNAEFDEAIRTTIRMLPEGEREETQVKKKLSMGLVMAILMILALTCAAVAVGMGVFGKMAEQTKDKGYAQLYQTLDEKSVEVGEVQTAEKNDDGQKVTFKLAQAYVDGNSLFLSYEASGMQSSVDYSWTPTEEEREKMQQCDTILDADTGNEIFDELMQTWKTEGTDADAVIISHMNSFGVYQAGTDEYWNPRFSDERITADGTAIGIKVFELCDEVLELEMPSNTRPEQYQTFVFDGSTYKSIGPFDTQEELFNALKDYTDAEVEAGTMTQAEATALLEKYQ